MGLDMYLTRRAYIGNKHKEKKEQVKIVTPEIKSTFSDVGIIKNERIAEIIEDVCYWRKANAIHNWFVENVQNGVDDCKEYSVSETQLKELVSICKDVLQDHTKADELLPTADGFFFGDTDYSDYYFETLERTVTELEQVLSETKYANYYYTSSW